MGLFPDASKKNQDWAKKTWDLPPYKSDEFYKGWPPEELDAFRKLPVYKFAVEKGLIVDDTWMGGPGDSI